MYFANSTILWALFALSIPILIHLFNFRRFKKVYFSNVSLLREIKIDTQSTNRLKHLLILLCRMLALLFLILAFAQPFLIKNKQNLKQGSSAISIFIDNSFSMNAENKTGNLLENAKKAAREIALAYKPSDKFQLLTNDFEGRHQRLISREEFLEMLDNVQLSASSKKMEQINSHQSDVLNSAQQNIKKAYIVSDFQKSFYKLKDTKIDTSFATVFVPFKANETTNIYIDSVWFNSPSHQQNQAEILNVRIKATGTEGQSFENIPIKLYINNEQKALASFNIETPASSTIQLNYTNKEKGTCECRIELQDHPITFDDNFYFTYNVNESISVNCINGSAENKYLNSLFANDSYCKFSNSSANNIDFSSLSTSNFIILNELKSISSGLAQELEKFVKNGGYLLIIPSNNIEIESYNNFFSSVNAQGFSNWDTTRTIVEKINLQHELYNDIFDVEKLNRKNLDLPIVFGHYNLTNKSISKAEYLLQLQNNHYFLFSSHIGKGNLFVSTSPFNPDYSNFVKHALFVPSIYKMAISSTSQNNLYYQLGINEIVKINTKDKNTEQLYHVINTSKKVDFIPATKIIDGEVIFNLHQQIKESNNYLVKNSENENLTSIAFNYNTNESNLGFYDEDNLESEIAASGFSNLSIINNKGKSLTQIVKDENIGKALWKTCIWLSLIFLLIEVLLLSPLLSNLLKKRTTVV